jgi:hypothetical protein
LHVQDIAVFKYNPIFARQTPDPLFCLVDDMIGDIKGMYRTVCVGQEPLRYVALATTYFQYGAGRGFRYQGIYRLAEIPHHPPDHGILRTIFIKCITDDDAVFHSW